MAKLLSLQKITQAIQNTFLRFPLEIITAIIATVYCCIMIEENSDTEYIFIKTIMCCSLCLVLFLSVSLFFSSSTKNKLIRYATALILGSLVVAFVFNFSEKITPVEALQFLVLNIALHLLVSFAGFLPKKYSQEEFWEFNKQLFLRILTSALYSSVIYAGLSLALLAVHILFNVEFPDKIYAHLFFIIAGIFNTIFFLAGIPDISQNENPLILNYPKGLKNFTQYVLLPLISIYSLILICYEVKITATLSLPEGWVSYLVLVFAIFGILSFLLIHPIAKEKNNLWMHTFSRWFYYLLIPLLALLFWAILYRVYLYGFTHERYYVVLLAIWLIIVVSYFLINKTPKIKFIPISMCIAALFSIVGPQSADSISKYSQLSRFKNYLEIIKTKKLNFKEEQNLSSITSFLEENYTSKVFLDLNEPKLQKLIKKDKDAGAFEIMKALGLTYHSDYESEKDIENETNFSYYYSPDNSKKIDILTGNDISFTVRDNLEIDCEQCATINSKKISIHTTKTDYGKLLKINNEEIPLRLFDFINKTPAFTKESYSKKKITQEVKSKDLEISITYNSIDGNIKNNIKTPESYEIEVMINFLNND
ncbi:MAG: DUF4153 domain-containing protein [Flavobacterium sp.]